MLRKIRRQRERVSSRKKTLGSIKRELRLESLEQRILLDTAGWWDELGWRGASGGGVTWDQHSDNAEAELALSVDGDPIIIWTEGTLSQYVGGNDGSGRMPYHFELDGPIYARQFSGDDLGWWDLNQGSADDTPIASGKELDAATGPTGNIVLVYVSNNDIYAQEWNGQQWQPLGGGLVSTEEGIYNEKPSVAISDAGEVFVSYTSYMPTVGQREIIVKKYGYDFGDSQAGPPQQTDQTWVELANEGVGNFDGTGTGGVSDDAGNSFDSVITVDLEGKPIVAWVDATWEANTEIYAKRWDGDSWEELGLYQDSGSASDLDGDGNSGISNDSTISMQPDIAVAPNGDVIVTWVNWQYWAGYQDYSGAGIFVKVLSPNSSIWEEYAPGSADGAGIAQDEDISSGRPGAGWYYQPKIEVDSQSHPYIVWQGLGQWEQGGEMAVFASHFEDGQFNLLYNEYEFRYSVNDGEFEAFMPTSVVGRNDELISAYTWHDVLDNSPHYDDEIFVQVWDPQAEQWGPLGRGSDSNGNDVIAGFNAGSNYETQMGLIDYDNDPLTEPDVLLAKAPHRGLFDPPNQGHMYLYNRETGQWTLDADISFGYVYDLRGEPEYEYQVEGPPLLAYIDEASGDPYVYEWIGTDWSLVGNPSINGGAAGEPGSMVYKGISVQAGPDGQIFLAYTRYNGHSYDILTRLWDPALGSWTDAGPGILDKFSGLEPAYYSEFTGYDFEQSSDLIDGTYDDFGRRIYELGQWYYWDISSDGELSNSDNRIDGSITNNLDSPFGDNIEISIDDADDNSDDTGIIPDTVIAGEVDLQFELINDGHVIIEMMYQLKPLNMTTDLYLTLDGQLIDADPDLPGLNPIRTAYSGELVGYNQNTEVTFDSKALGLEKLNEGLHTVGLRSLSHVTSPDINDTFPAEPGPNNWWTFIPDADAPYATFGAWDANATIVPGASDEAMVITLGDDAVSRDLTAQYDHLFYVAESGSPYLQFDYYFSTGAGINGDDSLYLEVYVDTVPVIQENLMYSLSGGQSYNYGTVDENLLDTLASFDPGYHTLTISGKLVIDSPSENPDRIATLVFDNVNVGTTDATFDTDPALTGWSFSTNSRGNTIGGYGEDADSQDSASAYAAVVAAGNNPNDGPNEELDSGGLIMLFDLNNADPQQLKGFLDYDFNMGGLVQISFDYELVLDQYFDAAETLLLDVYLDQVLINDPNNPIFWPDQDFTIGEYNNSNWQTFTILLGGDYFPELIPGPHTLRLEGTLTNNFSEQGSGQIRVDNLNITGIQQSFTRIDNFAVYQRVVPVSDEVSTNFDFVSDPLGGVNWFYDDVYTWEWNFENTKQFVEAENNFPDPEGDELGIWQDNIGVSGQTGDGALKIYLGDGLSISGYDQEEGIGPALEGQFVYTFNTDQSGYLDVDLMYYIQAGNNLPELIDPSDPASLLNIKPVALYIMVDGVHITDIDDYELTPTGNDVAMNSGWQTIKLENLYVSDEGEHTLQVGAVMPSSALGRPTYSESFNSGEVLFSGNGTWADSGDDGTARQVVNKKLQMYLNDDLRGGDLEAQVSHGYTLDHLEDLIFIFDYDFATGSGATLGSNPDETLALEVWLDTDGNPDTLEVLLDTIDSGIVVDGAKTSGQRGCIIDTSQVANLHHLLEAGLYNIVFKSVMTDASFNSNDWGKVNIDNVYIYEKSLSTASVTIDNVNIVTKGSYGDWEMIAAGGDTGGNNTVGPYIGPYYLFDDANDTGFQADLHMELATTGAQAYLIEDIAQNDYGQMIISFRYHVNSEIMHFGDISVLLGHDGVYEELESSQPLPLSFSNNFGWWNWDVNDPQYSWAQFVVEDVAPGYYSVKIELEDTEGPHAEMWIDNLTIVASELTNAYRPIATLAPTGRPDQPRSFTVGVMNSSPDLRVYANSQRDTVDPNSPWPDGRIYYTNLDDDDHKVLYPAFLDDGYTTASIFQLVGDQWEKYGGDLLSYRQSVDFLGVGSSESASMQLMPSDTVLLLEDMVTGPNQVQWVALMVAETEWTDTNGDGQLDNFEIHPWDWRADEDSIPIYWNVTHTKLYPQVWRWVNTEGGVGGQAYWDVALSLDNDNFVGYVPQVQFHTYTDLQLVSSGGQAPILAWNRMHSGITVEGSSAVRWEGIQASNDVWGILGPSESIQNGDRWSAIWLRDMIATPDGDPIASFVMGQLYSIGLREFRTQTELPIIEVSEESGLSDDDKIDFGQINLGSINPVDQVITISNSGLGELLIYDIQMGGYGDLNANPFSLFNPPEGFPGTAVRIDPQAAESVDFIVRFDPTGVPAGIYDGVLLIYSNDAQQSGHPNRKHPFAHFYEVNIHVEVVSQAELDIDEDQLYLSFDDSIINGGGLRDLTGSFRQEFLVNAAGDVQLAFDYQMMLGQKLQDSQTLDLIVSVDGQPVTSSGQYQIIGGLTQDSGYLHAVLTLEDLTAGNHSLAFAAELSSSLGWGQGTGIIRLDNIAIAGANYDFIVNPGQNVWSFLADTEYPQATSGLWDPYAGPNADPDQNIPDGAMEMVLGYPLEIEELVIRNSGQSPLTLHEWYFASNAYRVLDINTDQIAGAVVNRLQLNGTFVEEIVSSQNLVDDADDVTLNPGDYLTFQIVFEPTYAGNFDVPLYITSDVLGSELVIVRLAGTGIGGANLLVEVDGMAIPDYDPLLDEYGKIDFGSVIRGQTKNVVVTLTNDGSTDLTIGSAKEFSAIQSIQIMPNIEELILAPGESTIVTLTYSPEASDVGEELDVLELDTILRIVSDDHDLLNTSYEIQVVGLGVPTIPLIQLIDTDTHEPVNRLNLGTTYIGQPIQKTFQVKNIGGTDLVLERFLITTGLDVFDVSPPNPAGTIGDITIPYGDDPYTITVTFTPDAAVASSSYLRVYYYDYTGQATYSSLNSVIQLVASGIGQQIQVTDSNGDPDDQMIDFGPVGVNQTAQAFITLENIGNSDLRITNWALAENSDDVFSLAEFPDEVVVLGHDETYQIAVDFNPDQLAQFDGSIVITSDDPNNSPWYIDLAGDGANPGAVLLTGENLTKLAQPQNTYELDFGSPIVVGPYAKITETLSIKNIGDSNLLVEAISLDQGPFGVSQILSINNPADDVLVAPGDEYALSVTFYAINFFDSQTSGTVAPQITITTDNLSDDNSTVSTVRLLAAATNSQATSQKSGSMISWTDANNQLVRVLLVGGGQATVYPAENEAVGFNSDIGLIELSGTSTNSMLIVLGPIAGTRIGGISGGVLRGILLQNVTVDGDMNDDGLEDDISGNEIDLGVLTGMLMVGNLDGGADISIGDIPAPGAMIRTGRIGMDSNITAHGKVTSFMSAGYGGNGKFQTDQDVGMVIINGGSLAGTLDIGGNLGFLSALGTTMTGKIHADNIQMLNVGGLDGAEIVVENTLGFLNCSGRMSDTAVLLGYNLGADREIGGGDDYALAGWHLGNMLVSGLVSDSYVLGGIVPLDAGDFNVFDNPPSLSTMRSGSMGMVRFGSVDDTAPTFGVAAYGTIGSVRVGATLVTEDFSPWDYFRVRKF